MLRIVNLAVFALFLVQQCWSASVFEFSEFDDPFSAFTTFNRNSLFRNLPGSECTASSSTEGITGVCKSPIDCRVTGGKNIGRGTCSFNSCCVYLRNGVDRFDEGQCGSQTSKKVSYFFNPKPKNIPQSDPCLFTVKAVSSAVCQIRLDFEDFEIAAPTKVDTNAFTCNDDWLEIIPPNKFKVPTICGYNTNQHMYIPMNASNNELSLTLRMIIANDRTKSNGLIASPKWRIRITQLECPSQKALTDKNAQGYYTNTPKDFWRLAPEGCLQYFTERTGTVASFNYRSTNAGDNPSRYIGGLNYAICIKKRPSTCGISITTAKEFTMSGDGMTCKDYLFIPEAKLKGSGTLPMITDYKYCGSVLSDTVSAATDGINFAPIYMHFFSDNMDNDMPTKEIGFKIKWELKDNCS